MNTEKLIRKVNFLFFYRRRICKSKKILDFITFFAPLFIHIRFKVKNRGVFRWIKAILIYLQQLLLFLKISLPSEHYLLGLSASPLTYAQSVAYFLTWIFATESYMCEQLLFLVVLIAFLIFLISTAKDYNSNKHISSWRLSTIFAFVSYFCPYFIFCLYFRISDTIELLMNKKTAPLYISLVIGVINIIFFIFYIYMNSVFLDSFSFVSNCKLDVYDGRGTVVFYLAQTFMCLCGHLINLSTVYFLNIIYILFGIFMACVVIFYRFVIMRHISLIGTYFELSNLVCYPFLLLINHFKISGAVYYGLFLLFHIIFIICINLSKRYKFRRATSTAAALLENTENKDFSQVISDTFQTSIRCLVISDPNPALFDRLLQIHHQSKLKTSLLLEVVRFLSVFPERRKEMIQLLQTLHSKNAYSAFTTRLYLDTLTSFEDNCPQIEFDFLTNLKQHFLVHQSLFWVQRSEKSYFKAFEESLSTSYCYFELNSELMYLLNRYPFDPHIYHQLGEFFLIGCGDYDTYHQLTDISNLIQSNKKAINDPLLHPISIYTPRIMQYRKIERNKSSGSFGLDTTTLNPSGTSSDSGTTVQTSGVSKSGTEDSSTSSVRVVTLLTTSKRKIPFFPLFHTLIALLFLYIYFVYEKPYESHTSLESESIAALLQYEATHINSIAADVLISVGISLTGLKKSPHERKNDALATHIFNYQYYQNSTEHLLNFNTTKDIKTFHQRTKKSSLKSNKRTLSNDSDLDPGIFRDFSFMSNICLENIHTIITESYTLLDECQQLSYLQQVLPEELSHNLYSAFANGTDSCASIASFDERIELTSLNEFLSIQDSILDINGRIDKLSQHIKKSYYVYRFVLAAIMLAVVFIFAWTTIWIVQVNSVFKNNQIAIEFLSSRERLSLLLLEKPEKAWQLMSDFVNEKGKLRLIQIAPNQINPLAKRNSKFSLSRVNNMSESKSTPDSEKEISMQEIANSSNNNPETHFNSSLNLELSVKGGSTTTTGSNADNPKLTEQQSSSALLTVNNGEPGSNMNRSSLMLRPRQGRTAITFVGYPKQLFKPTVSFNDQNLNRRPRRFFSAPQSENDDNDEPTGSKSLLNNDELSQMNKSTQSFSKRLLHTTGTGTGTDDNEHELDNDPLDTVVNETIVDTKVYWISLFLLLISPWFMMIAIFVLSIIPINERSNNEIAAVSVLLDLGNQINCFLQITKLTYYGLLHYDSINRTISDAIRNEILACNNYILASSSLVSQVYNREQCFMLEGVTCTSASKIVPKIATDLFPIDYSIPGEDVKNDVIYLYIPACLFVSRQLLSEIFYNDLIALANIKHSADYCFLITIFLVCCATIFAAYVNQKVVVRGFNSLFHYPESLEKEKKKDQQFTSLLDSKSKPLEVEDSKITTKKEKVIEKSKFPSLILIVSYVAETDEIYSISENAQSILQKPPQEFISQKFNETFCLIENTEDVEMREYLMPDKKRKKQFRSCTENLGQIIKCVMIEEKGNVAYQKQATPSAQPKVENIANKLSFFVPSSFSKKFGEENIISYNYSNSILLLIRFKTNIAYSVIDKFFASLNTQVMNYASIDILKVDGSIITLSTIPETDPIIPFLFIRDVYNDCNNLSKGKPEMFALDSIVVMKSANTTMEMKDGLEPYLDISIPNYETMLKMIYSSKSNECYISNDLIKQFPNLKGELIQNENQILNIEVFSVPLQKIFAYFTTSV